MDIVVLPRDRRAYVSMLVALVICVLASYSDGSRMDRVKFSSPKGLPYMCSTRGEPMHYCKDYRLCLDKKCPGNSRCVESYCGGCKASCARTRNPTPCKNRDWGPVCGRDGKTYMSTCHARRAGVQVANTGACKPTDNSCSCDLEFAPVCASDGNFYINRCVAEVCAMKTISRWATCARQTPDPDCFCPAVFDPVCGIDGVTYSNACVAGCFGVPVAFPGECPEICKRDGEPCHLRSGGCCGDLKCVQYPTAYYGATVGVCKSVPGN